MKKCKKAVIFKKNKDTRSTAGNTLPGLVNVPDADSSSRSRYFLDEWVSTGEKMAAPKSSIINQNPLRDGIGEPILSICGGKKS